MIKRFKRQLQIFYKQHIKYVQWADVMATFIFRFIGGVSLLIFFLIFFFLLKNSFLFLFSKEGISTLFSFNWNPTSFKHASFGIIPMLVSTIMVTFGAIMVAGPLGILTSVFISEYFKKSWRLFFRSLVEIFSSIPSVIIGLIGVLIVSPLVSHVFHLENIFNGYVASFLVGVMALPTVTAVALDVFEDAPASLYIASRGLGASKWETIYKVIIPWAKPRLLTAIMLGIGRAVGETMIVLMVAGNSVGIPLGYGSSVRTFTSTIAIEMGEVAYGSLHYSALFTLGLILFLFTLIINYTIDKVSNSGSKI
jgi:phosphate transport system permease protein